MDAARTIQHNATRADLEALPSHLRGELIDGVLYAMTRPRARHQAVAGAIADDLFGPYHRVRVEPFDATPLDVLGWWEALDAVP